MKLSDIAYERPDIAQVEEKLSTLIDSFEEATSSEEQKATMDHINALRNNFDTYSELASIRYSIDTINKTNQEEKTFFDNNRPLVDSLINDYYRALAGSKFRDDLEEEFGAQLFDIAELTAKTIDTTVLEELRQENLLRSEYMKLRASAKIMFEGQEVNLTGLVPYMSSEDREVRKKARQAHANFYATHGEQFDRIFDDLVKLRHNVALKLGFNNFVEMGYARMTRTDYNAEMVANFRQQVLDYVVPLAQQLRQQQAERIGVNKLKYHDNDLLFANGNPKPQGAPEWIEEQALAMYDELSPETKEFFRYMKDNELMDLVNRKGKAGGGYCTFIPNTRSPFIFSNFNGTAGDIRVLVHEAGHAFQVYCSRGIEIPEYNWPTYEACEIHSMSMEFLTWPWMKLFFGEDEMKYKYEHVVRSIYFLPYGVAVDEFQHFVYENPEATPAERKAYWRTIEQKYLPHLDYEGYPFMEEGGFWQGQLHIYKMPFYYIDYTLALICAFQFWQKNEADSQAAWIDYLHLCKAGGSESFLKLVELANLRSPFETGCLEDIVDKVKNWIDGVDQAQL